MRLLSKTNNSTDDINRRDFVQRAAMTAAALLGCVALVSACGGNASDATAPNPTTIEFNVTTTGVDIDPDGFAVAVDGQSGILPLNGSLSITVTPGPHTIGFSGVAFNCDLVGAPSSTNFARGTNTRVNIQVSCTPYLRNTIVYTSDEFDGAVMAMRSDGSRRVRLTNDPPAYAAPAVSPDGQTIAVAYYDTAWDAIYTLDRFGKGRTKLVGGGKSVGDPAWSPDGRKLAFRSAVTTPIGDFGRIFVVNRDGTGLRQLTPDPKPFDNPNYVYDQAPSWSPDGTRILFWRMGELSFINLDGTGLVSTGIIGSEPSWSRDGTHIAYANSGIWVMDMSFIPHRINTQAADMPRWSPDGSQLVYQRDEGGVFQLYKMGADGSGVTKLSTSLKSDTWPSWSPTF